MKKQILILALAICQSAILSAQKFQWAKQMGGSSWDIGYSIAVDGSSNVYTTGYFEGTVDFDPGAGTFNLTSAGSGDIFISKIDTSGNFIWAKQMGGTSDDKGYSIAMDASGNVYTTGYFNSGTADFDPGSGTFNLISAGSNDIFISKLDASGNFIWAKQMGGTSSDRGYSITVDASGNVYTTGYFMGTADFDPGSGTYNLTSAGTYDIFISKLDASGNFIWTKQMRGTLSDRGYSIAADAFGNVYTTGYFQGTVDFDPGSGTFNLTSAGNYDIFISKLDTSGNFIWAKQLGGTLYDNGNSIAVDASGNVYTTGYFEGTADFDPGAGTFNLISAGSGDVFISKLDTSGNFIWAKQLGSTSSDKANSIVVDASGNIYTTGYFEGTADFDPGAGTFNLASAGSGDIFISKLDASGNFSWAKQIGWTSLDEGTSVAVDVSGNVYATGDFQGTADFDPGAGTFNLTSAGIYDIFVHKMSQCIKTYFSISPTSCDSYTVPSGDETYTASGTYTDTISNAEGCDSVLTINLTIINNTIDTINPTVCDSYTVPSGDETYTVSGTYTDTICDSVLTINLTINNSTTATINPTASGSYTVPSGGETYTVSGIYTDIIPNAAGCDSVLTINLTIITGINSIDNQLDNVNIYPNPAKEELYIAFNLDKKENVTIRLNNLLGQKVYEEKYKDIVEQKLAISTKNIPAGIYLVEIEILGEKRLERAAVVK